MPEFFSRKPIIGMVHLAPLPGSPRDSGDFARTLRRAVEDACALEEGGADAVLVENFFDAPFYKTDVPPHTIAAMTAAVSAVREAISLPVGVNVLRNDVRAAIAIAHVCGARFVRCNVYVGAVVTDQGIIEGAAREAMSYRRALSADVWIWADVGVKHAAPLGVDSLGQGSRLHHWFEEPGQEARDAVERGQADALIVTGPATGMATSVARVREVKAAVPAVPVLAGSGVTVENAAQLLAAADGAIVGTGLKKDGRVDAPVVAERVKAVVEAVRKRR